MKSAVITGLGSVTPLSLDHANFARRMFAGESGVRDVSELGARADFPIRCAGLLPPGLYPALGANAYGQEYETLWRHLIRDFLTREKDFRPFDAIVWGTNSGLAKIEDLRSFAASGAVTLNHLRAEFGTEFALRELAPYGQPALAPESQIVCANGCITGLVAIAYAYQRVRLGLNKRILIVCDETRVRPEDLLKYNALGALSKSKDPAYKVSRPFSQGREGFVKGEGAGLLVVEEAAHARARGALICARIAGYGQSTDAWRLTDGREDFAGVTRAMEIALDQAGLPRDAIDYINAHGTSTVKNDWLETQAIKKIFGAHAYKLAVSSLKSQIGHLNFACGLVETVACLEMLMHQTVAPTLNYFPDPECDLDYLGGGRGEKRHLRHLMKNSFGFGGANACLILESV